jgi:hypothetical protein
VDVGIILETDNDVIYKKPKGNETDFGILLTRHGKCKRNSLLTLT